MIELFESQGIKFDEVYIDEHYPHENSPNRKPNTGMLHATFPAAGDYRLWIQLMDRGELKTVPLSVTVSK